LSPTLTHPGGDLLEHLPDGPLSKRELLAAFRISEKTLRNWVKKLGFPRPVKLSPCCHRWLKASVVAWLAGREEVGHA
jgi:predicted DNA-binding transcriptional regulator AlpA